MAVLVGAIPTSRFIKSPASRDVGIAPTIVIRIDYQAIIQRPILNGRL